MKHISFLGASGTVTGSSYFLSDKTGSGILIDLGLFQGSDEIESFNYEAIPLHPKHIKAVFLTHAHLDHCGRLPLLRQLGFTGLIYMTEATRSLIELTLLDAVKVASYHDNRRKLYTEHDVAWLLKRCRPVEYHTPVDAGSFSVTFRDAGHILGSAFLEISCFDQEDGVSKIVFSGDIGNYPEELMKPTESVNEADVVVMESTYGDRSHSPEDADSVLTEEIKAIEENHGTLLIPAFSIERSQELLHMIDHLKKDRKIGDDTLVFLDSVLAIKVTSVYQKYRNLYNAELTKHANIDDPFSFPGLFMVERHTESLKIDAFPGPKVIIAGSGMMNGGRILRHAAEYLPQDTTRVLFVGFQAEGTLGRALLEGQTNVRIDGMNVTVRAKVRKSSGLSSHADQPKLLSWFSKIQGVSSICLTHGEDMQRRVLEDKIQEIDSKIAVYRPKRLEQLHFGKDAPKQVYAGSSSTRRSKIFVPSHHLFA